MVTRQGVFQGQISLPKHRLGRVRRADSGIGFLKKAPNGASILLLIHAMKRLLLTEHSSVIRNAYPVRGFLFIEKAYIKRNHTPLGVFFVPAFSHSAASGGTAANHFQISLPEHRPGRVRLAHRRVLNFCSFSFKRKGKGNIVQCGLQIRPNKGKKSILADAMELRFFHLLCVSQK